MEAIKILLIEDDELTNKELSETLKKESYNVITSKNGKEAIKIFDNEKPDIVISDLKLPGMDGIELLEKIKIKNSNTPFILITAFGEVDVALKAIHMGALDYLKKPINIEDLLIALGRAKEKVAINKELKDFPTILFAEDNEVARMNLAEVMKSEGLNVIETNNGEEALEIFKQKKIDIAVMDIKMPKMDGITSLNHMNKINHDFEVIILTGYGDENVAIETLRNGAMSFIKKPIDLEELLIQIEKAKNKLTIERSYKYRLRELELAHQIIAHLSQNSEIKLTQSVFEEVKDNISKFFNLISDVIILINENNEIKFLNDKAKEELKTIPEQLDEKVIEKIKKTSKNDFESENLLKKVKEFSTKPTGSIEKIKSNNKKPVILTTIDLKIEEEYKNYMLIIIPAI